jgi:hypothetical protein
MASTLGGAMNGSPIGLARAVVLALFAVPAAAGTIDYDFSYSGSGVLVTGEVTVDTSTGVVSSISGTRNLTETITGLEPLGAYGRNDNTVYPGNMSTGPYLDDFGLAFDTDATPSPINVYYDGSHYFECYGNGGSYSGGIYCASSHVLDSFTLTPDLDAVPGPIVGAGLPGLIAACGGLLAWWRRRRQAA